MNNKNKLIKKIVYFNILNLSKNQCGEISHIFCFIIGCSVSYGVSKYIKNKKIINNDNKEMDEINQKKEIDEINQRNKINYDILFLISILKDIRIEPLINLEINNEFNSSIMKINKIQQMFENFYTNFISNCKNKKINIINELKSNKELNEMLVNYLDIIKIKNINVFEEMNNFNKILFKILTIVEIKINREYKEELIKV